MNHDSIHAHLRNERQSLLVRLNTEWHDRAMRVFTFIVLAHWAEHLVQAVQVYVLHWPIPAARGVLGLWFPWLIKSEVLHYGYALVMLVGLFLLLPGFVGRARTWWLVALGIQFWHHIEHALLQYQALTHHNFFGSPVPTSLIQLVLRRLELHLVYNTAVFIPMLIATYWHLFPAAESPAPRCNCAMRKPLVA